MEIVVRASIVFFFLWIVTRAMGKRELAQMSPFELVLLVVMGDLVQQGVTQEDMSVFGAVLAVGTISVWVLVFSYLGFRFERARTVMDSPPVIVLHNGRLVPEVLRAERLTEDEVKEEARMQGIADLSDVEVGILEPGGSFSFVLKGGPAPQQQHRGETTAPA
jgi:uncharacterized membrane protein YcaP (DUF421 family)